MAGRGESAAGETRYLIVSAEIEASERRLRVRWADGHESRFHFVWLRHGRFYPANTGTDPADESLRLPEAPEALSLAGLEAGPDGLTLRWSHDGATTRHAARWLREHCYAAAARAERRHRPRLWTGATAAALPWFERAELADDAAVTRLLMAVRDHGFARIRNVPAEPDGVERGGLEGVAELFGPIHETCYGRVFEVKTQSDFAIGATRACFLGPHTDENYRHAPPGISFFHCLEASARGGDSILVDGFLAAARLAERDADAFALLGRVPLRFVGDSQDNDHFWASGRVISRDLDGEVVGIRYTDRTLPPLDLPEDLIEPAYRALRAFAQELYRPDLALRYRMAPGDLHVFDNQRVLHGRSAFDPAAGPRHLRQCAVDRDEFHYRLRLLALRRGLKDAGLVMAGGALG